MNHLPLRLLLPLAQSTAQARFPKPEFENYIEPVLELEPTLADDGWLRVAILVVLMLLAGLAAYRWKSRSALLAISALTLLVSGFLLSPCPCPVGLQSSFMASFGNSPPLPLPLLLLLLLPLAVALLFGRLFCLGGCPLGAIQELVHLRTIHVPLALDRLLRFLPIIILLLASVTAAIGGGLWICHLDPFLPIFTLSFATPAIWLGVVLTLLSIFISRPFCRYLCAYGVLLRFFSLFSSRRLSITKGTCVNCRLCAQSCPNGAILSPEPISWPEKHAVGRQRVQRLLVIAPLAIAVGAWLGFALAPWIAQSNPDVALVRELAASSDRTSDTIMAFLSSGRPETDLHRSAWQAERIAQRGMAGAGALLAIIILAELLSLNRRRPLQRHHEIDSSLCLVCGRCFATCPVEVKRKGNSQRPLQGQGIF